MNLLISTILLFLDLDIDFIVIFSIARKKSCCPDGVQSMDPTQIQMNVRHNAEDLQSFLRDMNSWEQDMKKKDECLRQERQEAQAKVCMSLCLSVCL